MDTKQLQAFLGSAIYGSHGQYFKELITHDYDITKYYDGGHGWGDVSRVLVIVSYIRGLRSYDEYLKFYEGVKQDDDGGAVTPRVYAKLTGIKRTPQTQTDRTREYRRRIMQELKDLRESTALAWIDDNLEQAQAYISNKITDTK